jgi:hypothetical protein
MRRASLSRVAPAVKRGAARQRADATLRSRPPAPPIDSLAASEARAVMSPETPRILYLAGLGRSGSTLLDSILDQIDGIFTAGEIHYLWDRSLGEDRLCACGEPFSRCPLWREVMAAFHAGGEPVDARRLVALREGVTPFGALAGRFRSRPAGERRDLAPYLAAMARLYRAIHRVTGCRAIVDSSKSPAWGWLVESLPGFRFAAVQVVRDARASAYAWSKEMVYDPSGDEPMLMTRMSAARSARQWVKWNLAAELLWRRWPGGYLRLRYEDFVAAPQRVVAEVARLALDEAPGALPFRGAAEVELRASHSMAGNPSRFQSGVVALRRDEAWRERLPRRQRRLVTALTWPLLVRYGYPL